MGPEANKRLSKWVLPILCLIVTGAGCDLVDIDDERRQLGTISFYDDPMVIHAPDTVLTGAPFTVSIRTYGNGCIRQGYTEVVTRALHADIRPYDIHSGARICTDNLVITNHQAAVRFDRGGQAEVVITGHQKPEDTILVVTRTVVVR